MTTASPAITSGGYSQGKVMGENQHSHLKRSWRIGWVFRALQNTVFVVWLVVALISMSVTTTIWAAYATWQATQLTYRVAELSYQNRKAIARALAKARLRRLATAVPFVGAGAAVYFERQTYQDWLEVNPERNTSDYACDMAAVTAEVIDEVFQDLPKAIRPSERMLRNFVPDCDAP